MHTFLDASKRALKLESCIFSIKNQTMLLFLIKRVIIVLVFVNRINENSSLCLNDKTNFLSTVRTQLATFLNTDPYNFLSIDCSAGSIILNFELVASDDVTAAQLNEAYQDLVVFLERGLLVLVRKIWRDVIYCCFW